MTLTFNFELMDNQELNDILSVSLGRFRRYLYHSKATGETNSKMQTIFRNNLKNLIASFVRDVHVRYLCSVLSQITLPTIVHFFE